MAYIGSSPTKVVSRQSANIFTYTATANQTAFTGSDANGNTLACTPSDIMVHMNGLRLEESDFTATTTTVTLGSGAAAGDEVTITAFVTFETADAYTKSASDTRYVNTTGDTMTGNLTVDAGNGNQLTLDNGGERFTQISFKHNSAQEAALWYDATDNNLVAHANAGDGFQVQTGGTATMNVDSSGRVTMPYQPVAEAYYNANGQDGTYGATNKNNIVSKPGATHVNVGSMYASATGRFTVPTAGKYFAGVNGSQRDLNVVSYHYVFIRKNGTTQKFIYNTLNGHTGWTALSGSTIFDCAANDYIDFFVKNDSATNADRGGWDTNNYTKFFVYKLS